MLDWRVSPGVECEAGTGPGSDKFLEGMVGVK